MWLISNIWWEIEITVSETIIAVKTFKYVSLFFPSESFIFPSRILKAKC
jgi:hypothetical protein